MKMEQWTDLEGLEPQIRARSNTWPLPRPENCVDGAIKEENGNYTGTTKPELDGVASGQVLTQVAKRNSSRKNAWGNLSYADLITQAIGSAPEKRLTLSQIYEWMIQNVPYFKDKGESNSSAGWKNSIRHNLSLHNKFMRIQNVGHGKSSWWMINPDVKTGKSTRRRAASMETSKFEKKRGRVRKKVEALRNGLVTADATSSPGSSISEGSEIFPESPLHSTAVFQLSPDIRPRDSSSASSCGRLSPIPAAESEWIDSFSHPSVYSSEQGGGYLAENVKTQQGEFANNATPESEFNNSYPGIGQAALPYEISQCPLHRVQGCGCTLFQSTGESHSPDGVSPVCPQSEPSSDSLLDPQMGYDQLRQPSNSSSSTIMGQLMGALNSSMTLNDLNLNIDTFHGGFDCNVDEVIRHELSMDGSLDFNFSQNQIDLMGGQTVTDSNTLHPLSSYPTTLNVTGSSWVL